MRIVDMDGTEVKDPDLEKGYLQADKIVKRHVDAILADPGAWHFEDTESGDTVRVWDRMPVPGQPEITETEDVQRYITYTEEELLQISLRKKREQEKQEHLAEAREERARAKQDQEDRIAALEAAAVELAGMAAEDKGVDEEQDKALVELAGMAGGKE